MKRNIILILVFTLTAFGTLFAFGNKENIKERATANNTTVGYNYEVSIDNMTCSLCDVAVEKQLSKLDWIQAVEGDHKTGLALLKIDQPLDKADMEKIINAELDKIDYNFVELKELNNG